jgi:hypothetical protein
MRVPTEIRFTEFDAPITAGGVWSGNSPLLTGYMVGVRVKPATESTQYDISITDKDGYVIFERKGIKGTMQTYIANGPIPIRSVVTVALANATAAETFNLDLIMDP